MRPLGRRRANGLIAKVAEIHTGDGKDPQKVERALSQLATKMNEVIADGVFRADVELVDGPNVIMHGLQRTPSMVELAPKTASAAFGWGWDPAQATNPRPLLVTVIEVVGGPITARVEVR